MGIHHSRLTEARSTTAAPGHRPEGAAVGSALRLVLHRHRLRLHRDRRAARPTVRAMHHTIKGTRPDGPATTPTTPTGCAGTTPPWSGASPPRTSYYHRGRCAARRLDRYYGEFVRVGHALGGTDLPDHQGRDAGLPGVVSAAAGGDPRQRDGDREPDRPDPGCCRLGHPRHDANWAHNWSCTSRPNILERTARRTAVWILAQRSVRRGRPGSRVPAGSGQGRSRARACRTPCRRTCSATIRSGAATMSSSASSPASASGHERRDNWSYVSEDLEPASTSTCNLRHHE